MKPKSDALYCATGKHLRAEHEIINCQGYRVCAVCSRERSAAYKAERRAGKAPKAQATTCCLDPHCFVCAGTNRRVEIVRAR